MKQNKCCKNCLNSPGALKGKFKKEFGGICGVICNCHWKSKKEGWEKDFDKKIWKSWLDDSFNFLGPYKNQKKQQLIDFIKEVLTV